MINDFTCLTGMAHQAHPNIAPSPLTEDLGMPPIAPNTANGTQQSHRATHPASSNIAPSHYTQHITTWHPVMTPRHSTQPWHPEKASKHGTMATSITNMAPTKWHNKYLGMPQTPKISNMTPSHGSQTA